MREAGCEAAADWIGYGREHDRNGPGLAGKGDNPGRAPTDERIGPQFDQLFCKRPEPIRITFGPAKFDPVITVFPPPQLLELIPECRNPNLPSRIALQKVHKHADSPNAPALLRPHHKRPRSHRAAKQRDERAALHLPPHSITSSARASSVG